ncbi:MAG TPA: hypothetical protein VFM38_09335, partial [Candidatus Limnocylindrales bacterium]|nr:hypothetical protein [Candidatus Limnocylindrales bacterium]
DVNPPPPRHPGRAMPRFSFLRACIPLLLRASVDSALAEPTPQTPLARFGAKGASLKQAAACGGA